MPRFLLCDLNINIFDTDATKEWWILLLLLSSPPMLLVHEMNRMGSHGDTHQYRRRTSFSAQLLPLKERLALQFPHFAEIMLHSRVTPASRQSPGMASRMIYGNTESSGVWVACLVNTE